MTQDPILSHAYPKWNKSFLKNNNLNYFPVFNFLLRMPKCCSNKIRFRSFSKIGFPQRIHLNLPYYADFLQVRVSKRRIERN